LNKHTLSLLLFIGLLIAILVLASEVTLNYSGVKLWSLANAFLPIILGSNALVLFTVLGILFFLAAYISSNTKYFVVLGFIAALLIQIIVSVNCYGLFTDQPRVEMGLAENSLFHGARIEDLKSITDYFNWPGAWMLDGVIKNVTGLDSIWMPSVMAMLTSFALLLLIYVLAKNIWRSDKLAVLAIFLFSLVPVGHVIQYCPGLYGMVAFSVLLLGLIKVKPSIIILSLTAAVIAHPVTAVFSLSTVSLFMLYENRKSFFHRLKRTERFSTEFRNRLIPLFLISVAIFCLWQVLYVSSSMPYAFHQLIWQETSTNYQINASPLFVNSQFYFFLSSYRWVAYLVLAISGFFALRRLNQCKHVVIGLMGCLLGAIVLFNMNVTYEFVLFFFTFVPLLSVYAFKCLSHRLTRPFINRLACGFIACLAVISVLSFIANTPIYSDYLSTGQLYTATFMATNWDGIKSLEWPNSKLQYFIPEPEFMVQTLDTIYYNPKIFYVNGSLSYDAMLNHYRGESDALIAVTTNEQVRMYWQFLVPGSWWQNLDYNLMNQQGFSLVYNNQEDILIAR
jgi:hypothetical protein